MGAISPDVVPHTRNGDLRVANNMCNVCFC